MTKKSLKLIDEFTKELIQENITYHLNVYDEDNDRTHSYVFTRPSSLELQKEWEVKPVMSELIERD